jgi:hypothetical protein
MPTVIVIDEISIRQIIHEEVASALTEHLPALIAKGTAKQILTDDEVADMVGYSKRALAYRRARGDIAYIKRGRRILYRAEDVQAFLESGRVPVWRRGGLE